MVPNASKVKRSPLIRIFPSGLIAAVSAKSIVLPNLESGTIQLAGLANGAVTVVGASGDIQTIPVKTYVGPTDG